MSLDTVPDTPPATAPALCASCQTHQASTAPPLAAQDIPARLAKLSRDPDPAVAHVAGAALVWHQESEHQQQRLAWAARHDADSLPARRRDAAISQALAAELAVVAHDAKAVSQA